MNASSNYQHWGQPAAAAAVIYVSSFGSNVRLNPGGIWFRFFSVTSIELDNSTSNLYLIDTKTLIRG